MNIWIVCVGEPLICDGENVRLRRMGLLAEYLAMRKHQVHWFSASFDHYQKRQRCETDENININGKYTLHLMKANGYKKNVSLARILHHYVTAQKFKKIAKNMKPPDIIICSMEPLEMSQAAVQYAKEKNVNIVVDIRDLWPDIFAEVVPKALKPFVMPYVWYNRKILSNTLSQATALTSLTDEYLKFGLHYAQREKTPLDKVVYMAYKNIDFEFKSECFKKDWGQYGITPDDFIIIFLGNFGRQFEFEPILHAAKLLRNYKKIKFVLCGEGEHLDEISQSMREYCNVKFPGWINAEKIKSLMASASIGIAPYRNSINFTKNVPNKFGEYISAGLPVFIGIEGVMKDLIKQYCCGEYYLNGDVLSNLIVKYYNNPNSLKQLSNNAKILYDKSFNSDVVYNEFVNYLETISEV